MTSKQIVTVYGASNPKPGDPVYQLGEQMGRLLGDAGYAVMTGGYSGTMEAVSKGAKEVGAHVIGVTVSIFEVPGGRPGPNPYVDEVIRYDTLRDRLYHLVTRCDAAIALPGGIGTLSEVALTWSLLQVRETGPMPFVLLGDGWGDLLSLFYADGQFIRADDMNLWKTAQTPAEAVRLLKTWSA